MQEFVSDLLMESKGSLFSQGQHDEDSMDKCPDMKDSLSSLTANMKMTSTKGTQTNSHNPRSKLLTLQNSDFKQISKQKKSLN